MQYKNSSKYYRVLVFIIGIIATIAYRIIVILNYYSSLWVEIAWYIGTIGFIWYFAHRYRVQNYQRKVATQRKLREKVCKNKLDKEDCEALDYILRSLVSSKARWNSIMIFTLSAVALVYAIVLDIIKIYNK